MISVTILNWARPAMLTDFILPIVERYSNVSEIIISHGKKETAFGYKSRHCRIVHIEDWDRNEIYGLSRRFWLVEKAANEIIFQQDDDLLLPEKSLEQLLVYYRRQPGVIHGIGGREIDLSLYYNARGAFGDVLLLLARSMMFSRELAKCFLDSDYQRMQDFMRQSNFGVLWNGEDIFQSLAAFKHSGLPNKAHTLPCVELGNIANNSEAICFHPNHCSERTQFLRYAVEKMGLQEQVAELIKSIRAGRSVNSCRKPSGAHVYSRYPPPPPPSRCE